MRFQRCGINMAGPSSLPAEWNAGTVAALGSGLAITGGTIAATAVASEWNAGTVSAVGAGLAITAGTIAATGGGASQWNAGTVSAVGPGLAITAGTINASALTSVHSLPFALVGHVAGGQKSTIALTQAGVLLANGGAPAAYVGTAPTAANDLALNTIHNGSVTTLGTIVVSTAGAVTFPTFPLTSIAAGDAVQIVNQATADASFGDVSLSLQFQVTGPAIIKTATGTGISATAGAAAVGYPLWSKIIPGVSGTVTSLQFNSPTAYGGVAVQMALYTDNAGLPGTLVNYGGISGIAVGINSVPIASSGMTGGTPYWLAIAPNATINISEATGPVLAAAYYVAASYGTWPNNPAVLGPAAYAFWFQSTT
jgi:hypothetical protein